MKGRKPDQNAIRRGIKDNFITTTADQPKQGVEMPADIAIDPVQSAIWDMIAPPVNNFIEADIPTLKLLCYWHAVAAHAQQEMAGEIGTGKVNVLIKTDKGYTKHPSLNTLKQASAEIRALNDQLGLSPLARSRIGLLQVTTVKTATETASMFKSIDGAYGDLS